MLRGCYGENAPVEYGLDAAQRADSPAAAETCHRPRYSEEGIAVGSVCLSVCFHDVFRLLACGWVMAIFRRRLKVKVTGQSQDRGLELG